MKSLLMTVRTDPDMPADAEPVLVEHHDGQVILTLDDGVTISLDRTELLTAIVGPHERREAA